MPGGLVDKIVYVVMPFILPHFYDYTINMDDITVSVLAISFVPQYLVVTN